MQTSLTVYLVIAVLAIVVLASAIRVFREYERGVMFTLGRFTGVKGPGLILMLPYIQQMVRVDLRTIVLDVPSQDVISRDNVSVKVNAVLYFRVVDRRQGGDPGRGLHGGDQPARADHACARCWASTRSTRCCPNATS